MCDLPDFDIQIDGLLDDVCFNEDLREIRDSHVALGKQILFLMELFCDEEPDDDDE